MKPIFLLVAAGALALSACGGGKAQYPVNVEAIGVQYDGLVVSTNGQTLTFRSGGTDPNNVQHAQFAQTLSYGDVYSLHVETEPPHQSCTLSPYKLNSDTAGHTASIQTGVICALSQHGVGGTIVGLTAKDLVLTGGSSGVTFTPEATATTFFMPTGVEYGATYGVTVLQQPATQHCVVANGVGIMGDANVTDITVTCTAK
jgi:hypothetical protein